jgi:uncharacterized protein YlxP (DUF503 family)
MESITIYPKNEKQKSLLKALLEELKVRFEIGINPVDTFLTETDFYKKIDKSIKEANDGKVTKLSKENQKKILGL